MVHILVRAMDRTKNLSRMVNILVRAMDRTKNLSIMVHILVRAMDRTKNLEYNGTHSSKSNGQDKES